VSFYWGETTDSAGGTVPAYLTEDITPFFRAMKGSNQKYPHCIALEGQVGTSVCCGIYAQRSSACRDFGIEFTTGQVITTMEDHERCTRARAHWGLPPIQVDIFRAPEKIPAHPSPGRLLRVANAENTPVPPNNHLPKVQLPLHPFSSSFLATHFALNRK